MDRLKKLHTQISCLIHDIDLFLFAGKQKNPGASFQLQVFSVENRIDVQDLFFSLHSRIYVIYQTIISLFPFSQSLDAKEAKILQEIIHQCRIINEKNTAISWIIFSTLNDREKKQLCQQLAELKNLALAWKNYALESTLNFFEKSL